MHLLDSDQMPLPGIAPLAKKRSLLRRAETMIMICLLFMGGFGTGYIYASRMGENALAQQRQDHLNEIARLQDAQANSLQSAARSTEKAASTVAEVATQTAANTEAVGEIAKKVDKAAAKVKP